MKPRGVRGPNVRLDEGKGSEVGVCVNAAEEMNGEIGRAHV